MGKVQNILHASPIQSNAPKETDKPNEVARQPTEVPRGVYVWGEVGKSRIPHISNIY
jgi:predicted ATPase